MVSGDAATRRSLARRSLGIATFILAGSLAADFIVPKVWRLVMRWQNAAFRKVCEAFYPPTLPVQALTLNLSCGRLPSGQRSKTRTSAVRVTHAHTRKQPAHRGRLPDQAELERRILSYSATAYRRA